MQLPVLVLVTLTQTRVKKLFCLFVVVFRCVYGGRGGGVFSFSKTSNRGRREGEGRRRK